MTITSLKSAQIPGKSLSKIGISKISKKSKKSPRKSKSKAKESIFSGKSNWKETCQEVAESVMNRMKISEVIDLSIMTKTIETSCQTRIQTHFSHLQFKLLNPMEIDVNGQKMTVFDVISFIKYLSTFKVVFLSADFQNFKDNSVIEAIFETVEKNSEKIVNYRVVDGVMTITHRALTQICIEIQETGVENCEKIIQEKYKGIPKIDTLRLELSSIGTSIYPKNVLKGILETVSPRTLEIVFTGSPEVIAPLLQYSDQYYLPYHFLTDNISEITPEKLNFCNIYWGKMEEATIPTSVITDNEVVITSYHSRSQLIMAGVIR